MGISQRLDRIEVEIKRRNKAIRDQVEKFFQGFSEREIDELFHYNQDAWARFEALGGFEILSLQEKILTPEERAERDRMEKELRDETQYGFIVRD
jgi:hypothetical protein